MVIKRIISGGQTGADQGGLYAAWTMDIETGGTATKGYRTQDGPNLRLKTQFGLVEHPSPKYPPRTSENVRNADATIRFAADFSSSGEECTMRAIKRFKKPYFDIDIHDPVPPYITVGWLLTNKVEVLNVAGNSESRAPGIFVFTKAYLMSVLRMIQASEDGLIPLD